MSPQSIDLFIPVAPKDICKLSYVVANAKSHLPIEDIYIATPDKSKVTQFNHANIHVYSDSEVLDFDRNRFKHRPNWDYQQFLKLLQNVTKNDWYLVIDADIIVNRYLPLWTNTDKPIMYLGRDQYHQSYFNFNKAILGFERVYHYSFLSECTLYNKHLIDYMLEDSGLNRDTFLIKSANIINDGCYPAESELYGNYIANAYDDKLYEFVHIMSSLGGRYSNATWTDEEIQDEIAKHKHDHVEPHLITLHSWSD